MRQGIWGRWTDLGLLGVAGNGVQAGEVFMTVGDSWEDEASVNFSTFD